MEDSGDQHAASLRLVEDDAAAMLKTPRARRDAVASSAEARRIRQYLEAPGKLVDVVLGPTPMMATLAIAFQGSPFGRVMLL
jgi:hypothetical protein